MIYNIRIINSFSLPTSTRKSAANVSGLLESWSGPEEVTVIHAPNDMPVMISSDNAAVRYRYRADGTRLSSAETVPGSSAGVGRLGSYVTQKRYDIGSFRFYNGGDTQPLRIERVSLPWGYFDAELQANVYLTDYQGNIRAVYNQSWNSIVQQTDYYPYGLPKATSSRAEANPYKYGGKELNTDLQQPFYDFSARMQLPQLGLFQRPDPKAGDYSGLNPYTYCGGDPINRTYQTGMEWRYIKCEGDKDPVFEWVDPKYAYDKDGNLLPDHYVQAISFSREGSNGEFDFDKNKDYNIGTSTATVYKADGSTEDFDACTNPSDPSKFATVPEGRYEAKVGKHKVNTPNEYPALRMGDVGTTNFYNNTIELGEPNPSNTSTTIAQWINIHKAGKNNYTGITKTGSGVSEGCILIDRNRWNTFIDIFDNSKQKNNIIGIIILR